MRKTAASLKSSSGAGEKSWIENAGATEEPQQGCEGKSGREYVSSDLMQLCTQLPSTSAMQEESLSAILRRLFSDGDKFDDGVERSSQDDGNVKNDKHTDTDVKNQADTELLSACHAFKLHQKGLYNVWCTKVRDASFFSANRAWAQFNHNFSI